MNVPASIAAEAAITRQNVALSIIKSNAKQSQQIANIIEKSVQSAPVSQARGTNLNILV